MTDNVPNAAERANGVKGVTTMVDVIFYQGTFNGAGHTLTVSYGSEDNRVGEVAPFKYLKNATIKYLHIDGNIYTNNNLTSGLARYTKNSSFLSCRISVCINSDRILIQSTFSEGYEDNTLDNCLFDGEIVSNYQPDGGEFSSGRGMIQCVSKVALSTITNCLVNPKNIQTLTECNIKTFYDEKQSPPKIFSNNYYLGLSGEYQGTDASSMTPEELASALGSAWMVDENNNVVPIMDFSNLASMHISLPQIIVWTSEPINLDYKVTDFDGNELTEGIHYTATITKDGEPVTEVIDEGDYLLSLTAITGCGYTGKKTHKFSVGDGLLQDADGTYYVVMPEIGSKTVMPRGKEDGFSFTIYNPRHPNSFGVGTTSDGSIIINAQGYTMSINGKIECIGRNDWVDNAYFEFYNGTKANNASPSYTTEGSNFHSQSLQFTPEGEQTEICFISGAHHEEHFYLTVTLTAIPYTITYNLNGGTPGEGHFTTYTTDMDYLPVAPIREGYGFAGWYNNENLSGKPLKSLRGMVGDKTLYARWKKSVDTHPDITISTPPDVTYNGAEFTPSITITDGETDIAKECEITYADNINAGTATITITAKPESNEYGGIATRTFKILPAPVTVTAEAKSKTFGESDPEFTATVTELINNDSPDLIKYTLTRTEGENAGEYTITAKGDEKQGNYVVSFVDATLTITKATPNPEPDPQNPSTPVSSIDNGGNNVKVWSYAHTIYIASAPDSQYKIIDLQGRTIKSATTKSSYEEVSINNSGIYVVIINNQSFKVSL